MPAELRIGERGGLVHVRPEKGQAENHRGHAEQHEQTPVEAIGISGDGSVVLEVGWNSVSRTWWRKKDPGGGG
jgi:hypothetical protein